MTEPSKNDIDFLEQYLDATEQPKYTTEIKARIAELEAEYSTQLRAKVANPRFIHTAAVGLYVLVDRG